MPYRKSTDLETHQTDPFDRSASRLENVPCALYEWV